MERYLDWLRSSGACATRGCAQKWSGSTPRAALTTACSRTETTWQPDDANFDLTYGRIASAYGPDAVSSHPVSRSPFGVDDLPQRHGADRVVAKARRDG
jgi:hypothetical protein